MSELADKITRELVEVPEGTMVFEKGDSLGDKLVFLLEGNFVDNSREQILVKEGQFIGQK